MELKEIRQKLHTMAELSGHESQTSAYVLELLKRHHPSRFWTDIGGHGVLAEFCFQEEGPAILIRADLDALPDPAGAAHLCGHDGHMTLALSLLNHLPSLKKGKLYLFFQPAEETGAGAKASLEHEVFQSLSLNAVFGLHNLPGLPLGEVVLCESTFACSSVGLKIKIQGRSSHAAEPENAHSPFPLMEALNKLTTDLTRPEKTEDFQLATLTHLKLGEESFGITPGNGEVFLTLRAVKDSSLSRMKTEILELLEGSDFKTSVEERDYFPATTVNNSLVKAFERVLTKEKIPFRKNDFPFRWSEDFGYLTQRYPGVYFGLGSGEKARPLHDTHYEFPDALLAPGAHVYRALVDSFLA